MKITYLVDFLRTVAAGTEGQLAHLLRAMPSFGYRLKLISLQSSPFLEQEAAQMFPAVDFTTLRGSSDLSRSWPVFISLYRCLRKENPDLVHTFFPASNSVGVVTARLAGIRRIISSRRDMGYDRTRTDLMLLRFADHFVSGIVANADAVRDETIRTECVQAEKIHVIRNGILVSAAHESLPPAPGRPVVGIVANLNRRVKRVDLFIHAASLVIKLRPDTEFWIVGDGPLRAELEQLASGLGVGSQIRFMGRRPDVQALLPSMLVGVLSSDSEGLSNSLIEYLCAGVPAIATAVGGNGEIIEDGKNGLLVPPGDPDALAGAILILLKDPARARAMGAAGREHVLQHFGVETMIDKTRMLYETICSFAPSHAEA
jgi:glycosyltransferase involved in cell wall biosynthesis